MIRMGLKQVERRIRVMQLRCSCYTEAQIAAVLGVSERTVRRDLRSSDAEEFVCELKRRQFKDIEECQDLKMRLDFRDKMLNKLMPKKSQPNNTRRKNTVCGSNVETRK